MEDFSLLAPLLLAIAGLLAGAVLKAVLRRSQFPYTVALFILGLAVGLCDRTGLLAAWPSVGEAVGGVADTNPDFILYVFLPVLIFNAAYEMDMHVFRKTLANATLLAVPGLVLCMGLTGLLLVGIGAVVPGYEQWNWSFALMFGALISATDPVAVVALLQELKTSKRFSTLVDAESLLNDGSGIICFMLFFGAYTASGSGDGMSPLPEFVKVVAGGAILGWLAARAAVAFITRIASDETVQNSVIVLSAYLTFILTQYYLGISGIIALVAFGLTVAYSGRPRLEPQVNAFMGKFWELLTYIANTLVFIMVGIVIAAKVSFSWVDLGVLVLIYAALNLIRFVMIRAFYPLMKRLGYGLTDRESVILTWGGLRGALGMTLALMVSYTPAIPETIRGHVLFFTAGIVTLTLVFNATTMRWLLRRLGLTQVPSARTAIEQKVRESVRESSEKYLERLRRHDSLRGADWGEVDRYLPAAVPDTADARPAGLIEEVRLRILVKEKSACRELHEQGVLSQTSLRRLIDSADELLDRDGACGLDCRASVFEPFERSFLRRGLPAGRLRRWWGNCRCRRIVRLYDLGHGFIALQRGGQALLNELAATPFAAEEQPEILRTLHAELERNVGRMERAMAVLSENYPRAYRRAITRRAVGMLLGNERKTIGRLLAEGILSPEDAETLLGDTKRREASRRSGEKTAANCCES